MCNHLEMQFNTTTQVVRPSENERNAKILTLISNFNISKKIFFLFVFYFEHFHLGTTETLSIMEFVFVQEIVMISSIVRLQYNSI